MVIGGNIEKVRPGGEQGGREHCRRRRDGGVVKGKDVGFVHWVQCGGGHRSGAIIGAGRGMLRERGEVTD